MDVITNIDRISILYGMYADAGEFYAQQYGYANYPGDCDSYPFTNADAGACDHDNEDTDPDGRTGTGVDGRTRRIPDPESGSGNDKLHTVQEP